MAIYSVRSVHFRRVLNAEVDLGNSNFISKSSVPKNLENIQNRKYQKSLEALGLLIKLDTLNRLRPFNTHRK